MTTQLLDRAVQTVAGLSLDRVPDEVLAHGARTIADTVATAVAGAREPAARALIDLLVDDGSITTSTAPDPQRPATVLGAGPFTARPNDAAFVNGTCGGFLELDEGIRPTGHPAMHIVPAALAVAQQQHAGGAELMRAVLAGYELTARLFSTIRLEYPLHPHGHLGAAGAAVACALLAGTDPVAAARIAATTPLLSVWDACFDGATARNSYLGIGARSAVSAVQLSRAGFTGSWSGLTTGIGGIAGHMDHLDRAAVPLDYRDLSITHNYFKRHSACALTHAAIDAVLELAPDPGERIEAVEVETVENNMKLDRQAVPNSLSTRFSLPYAVAAVIITGHSGPAAFGYRDEVAELATRVRISVAADLQEQWPDASPARVTIHVGNRTRTTTVRNPHGHWTDPLSPAELEDKFRTLVADRQRADSWWQNLTGLLDVADCATLFTGAGR